MCDALLQNYASAVNTHKNIKDDLHPTILLFDDPNCAANMYPRQSAGGYFMDNRHAPWKGGFDVSNKSFGSYFIPFNVELVRFYGGTKKGQMYKSDITGPFIELDSKNSIWQSHDPPTEHRPTVTFTDTPVRHIQIIKLRDWDTDVLEPLCMGRYRTLGSSPLSRYNPGQERCDYYMENQYCIGDRLQKSTSCGCYKNLQVIKTRSANLGVDLPVICFGEECSTTRTYKSQQMLSKPCNITICRQKIFESDGVYGTTSQDVFCGGHFFQNKGELERPSAVAILDVYEGVKGKKNDYITWVVLSVASVLFCLLVFLMFSSKTSKKSPSILNKIKELPKTSSKNKSPS